MVFTAAVLWGTTGTAQAFAPSGTHPAVLGAVRLMIGGIGLLSFALIRGAFRGYSRWPRRDTLLAAASVAAYQPFFFAAVARTGVVVGTIVAIGVSPILAGLSGLVLRGERPGQRWVIATALAIPGCILLLSAGGGVSVDTLGVLLALGAGASYALYTTFSKNLMEVRPPEAVMAVIFSLGALFLLPVLLSGDLRWLAQVRGIIVALHLGLVATSTAYILFARGLIRIPVASAVTLTLAEPLTAGILGTFVLRERLTPIALIGIGLLVIGLTWLIRERP